MTKREFDHNPRAVTKAREAAGLSKATLARRISCSPSLITEIEGGTRNAGEERLHQIAKALDCPVEQLRRRPDEPGGQAAETTDVDVPALQDAERADADDVPELRHVADHR